MGSVYLFWEYGSFEHQSKKKFLFWSIKNTELNSSSVKKKSLMNAGAFIFCDKNI